MTEAPVLQSFVPAYDLPSDEYGFQFFADSLYGTLVTEPDFQRLFRVPFLGSLSYLDNLSPTNTRGDHSIGVALLTYYFCRLWNAPKPAERTFVASALLHDIHHLPFSHTMELALRRELPGFSLSKKTRSIIRQPKPGGGSLENLLERFGVKSAELPLFKPRLQRPPIFGSTHNVDTLDGILRAHHVIFQDGTSVRKLPARIIQIAASPAQALPLSLDMLSLLDAFWDLKNKVYVDGIYVPAKVLFERTFGYYLFDLCRTHNLLEDLTLYSDSDLFSMFPDLQDKMQRLWHFISSRCSLRSDSSNQGSSAVLECRRNDEPSSTHENIHKFLITTRQFCVRRRTAIPRYEIAALRRRYYVRPNKTILVVTGSLLANIAEILEYPLLHKRFPHIAQETPDYLI